MSTETLDINWADSQLPSDPNQRASALRKRVSIHEFLTEGGLYLGSADGYAVYSAPVIAAETPDCPWHPQQDGYTPCMAWEEIRAGRGSDEWKAGQADLANMSVEDLAERVRLKREARILASQERYSTPPVDYRPVATTLMGPTADQRARGVLKKNLAGLHPSDSEIAPAPKAATNIAGALGVSVPDSIEFDGDDTEEEEE